MPAHRIHGTPPGGFDQTAGDQIERHVVDTALRSELHPAEFPAEYGRIIAAAVAHVGTTRFEAPVVTVQRVVLMSE